MATVIWVGGASPVSQLNTYTFGGTFSAADTVTVTAGSSSWTYTLTSGTIATFLPLLATAYDALDAATYPELAEAVTGDTSTTLTLTAATAGEPFAITLSTDSALGTIDGGASSAGVATVASAGPNDWSTAANWSTGTVPASSDSVYVQNSADDILYGLAQSAVTLTLLEIPASFTGTIGLPLTNTDSTSYPEYRTRHLTVSATTLNVGDGPGQGSGRLLFDVGTNACTLTVRRTGTGTDTDVEALQWKGTHASNVVNIYQGEMGVAGFAAEVATIATVRIGYEDSQGSDVHVRFGPGCTLTTLNVSGGVVALYSAATTLNVTGGTIDVRGSGAYTTITNTAGAITYRSSGTVATYVGGPSSSIDFTKDMRARTLTDCTLLPGATLTDSYGTVAFTNPITLSRARIGDVSLDVGYNRGIGVT